MSTTLAASSLRPKKARGRKTTRVTGVRASGATRRVAVCGREIPRSADNFRPPRNEVTELEQKLGTSATLGVQLRPSLPVDGRGMQGRRRGPAGRVRLITVRACTTFPRRGRIKSLRLTHSPFPSPILRSFPSPFEDTSSRVSPYVSLWAGTRVRTNLTSLTKLH